MSLMEQVEAALESVPPKSGITVLGPAPDHGLLASRDPLRGHGHVFVFLAMSGDIRPVQTNPTPAWAVPQESGGYVLERPVEEG